jgi:hypothetical protein
MSKSTLTPLVKKAYVIFAIFTGLNGLGCAFFQSIIGSIYEYNTTDLETLRLFGLSLISLAYLAIITVQSNSQETSQTVAKGILAFGALGIFGLALSSLLTGAQSTYTYLAVAFAYAVEGGLMLIPLNFYKHQRA